MVNAANIPRHHIQKTSILDTFYQVNVTNCKQLIFSFFLADIFNVFNLKRSSHTKRVHALTKWDNTAQSSLQSDAVFFALWQESRSRGPAPPVSHMGIKTCQETNQSPKKNMEGTAKTRALQGTGQKRGAIFLVKNLNKHKHQEALSQTWEKKECE